VLGLSGQSLDRAARIPQLGEFDQKRMTEWKFMEFHGIPVFLLSCHVLVCSLAGLRTSFAFSPVRSKLQGINITEALQHPWLQYAVRQLRWSSVDLPSEHGICTF
jgi:hypothetical protein